MYHIFRIIVAAFICRYAILTKSERTQRYGIDRLKNHFAEDEIKKRAYSHGKRNRYVFNTITKSTLYRKRDKISRSGKLKERKYINNNKNDKTHSYSEYYYDRTTIPKKELRKKLFSKKNLVQFRDSTGRVIATLVDPKSWNSANISLSQQDDRKRYIQNLHSLVYLKKHHIPLVKNHKNHDEISYKKNLVQFRDSKGRVIASLVDPKSWNSANVSLSRQDDAKRYIQNFRSLGFAKRDNLDAPKYQYPNEHLINDQISKDIRRNTTDSIGEFLPEPLKKEELKTRTGSKKELILNNSNSKLKASREQKPKDSTSENNRFQQQNQHSISKRSIESKYFKISKGQEQRYIQSLTRKRNSEYHKNKIKRNNIDYEPNNMQNGYALLDLNSIGFEQSLLQESNDVSLANEKTLQNEYAPKKSVRPTLPTEVRVVTNNPNQFRTQRVIFSDNGIHSQLEKRKVDKDNQIYQIHDIFRKLESLAQQRNISDIGSNNVTENKYYNVNTSQNLNNTSNSDNKTQVSNVNEQTSDSNEGGIINNSKSKNNLNDNSDEKVKSSKNKNNDVGANSSNNQSEYGKDGLLGNIDNNNNSNNDGDTNGANLSKIVKVVKNKSGYSDDGNVEVKFVDKIKSDIKDRAENKMKEMKEKEIYRDKDKEAFGEFEVNVVNEGDDKNSHNEVEDKENNIDISNFRKKINESKETAAIDASPDENFTNDDEENRILDGDVKIISKDQSNQLTSKIEEEKDLDIKVQKDSNNYLFVSPNPKHHVSSNSFHTLAPEKNDQSIQKDNVEQNNENTISKTITLTRPVIISDDDISTKRNTLPILNDNPMKRSDSLSYDSLSSRESNIPSDNIEFLMPSKVVNDQYDNADAAYLIAPYHHINDQELEGQIDIPISQDVDIYGDDDFHNVVEYNENQNNKHNLLNNNKRFQISNLFSPEENMDTDSDEITAILSDDTQPSETNNDTKTNNVTQKGNEIMDKMKMEEGNTSPKLVENSTKIELYISSDKNKEPQIKKVIKSQEEIELEKTSSFSEEQLRNELEKELKYIVSHQSPKKNPSPSSNQKESVKPTISSQNSKENLTSSGFHNAEKNRSSSSEEDKMLQESQDHYVEEKLQNDENKQLIYQEHLVNNKNHEPSTKDVYVKVSQGYSPIESKDHDKSEGKHSNEKLFINETNLDNQNNHEKEVYYAKVSVKEDKNTNKNNSNSKESTEAEFANSILENDNINKGEKIIQPKDDTEPESDWKTPFEKLKHRIKMLDSVMFNTDSSVERTAEEDVKKNEDVFSQANNPTQAQIVAAKSNNQPTRININLHLKTEEDEQHDQAIKSNNVEKDTQYHQNVGPVADKIFTVPIEVNPTDKTKGNDMNTNLNIKHDTGEDKKIDSENSIMQETNKKMDKLYDKMIGKMEEKPGLYQMTPDILKESIKAAFLDLAKEMNNQDRLFKERSQRTIEANNSQIDSTESLNKTVESSNIDKGNRENFSSFKPNNTLLSEKLNDQRNGPIPQTFNETTISFPKPLFNNESMKLSNQNIPIKTSSFNAGYQNNNDNNDLQPIRYASYPTFDKYLPNYNQISFANIKNRLENSNQEDMATGYYKKEQQKLEENVNKSMLCVCSPDKTNCKCKKIKPTISEKSHRRQDATAPPLTNECLPNMPCNNAFNLSPQQGFPLQFSRPVLQMPMFQQPMNPISQSQQLSVQQPLTQPQTMQYQSHQPLAQPQQGPVPVQQLQTQAQQIPLPQTLSQQQIPIMQQHQFQPQVMQLQQPQNLFPQVLNFPVMMGNNGGGPMHVFGGSVSNLCTGECATGNANNCYNPLCMCEHPPCNQEQHGPLSQSQHSMKVNPQVQDAAPYVPTAENSAHLSQFSGSVQVPCNTPPCSQSSSCFTPPCNVNEQSHPGCENIQCQNDLTNAQSCNNPPCGDNDVNPGFSVAMGGCSCQDGSLDCSCMGNPQAIQQSLLSSISQFPLCSNPPCLPQSCNNPPCSNTYQSNCQAPPCPTPQTIKLIIKKVEPKIQYVKTEKEVEQPKVIYPSPGLEQSRKPKVIFASPPRKSVNSGYDKLSSDLILNQGNRQTSRMTWNGNERQSPKVIYTSDSSDDPQQQVIIKKVRAPPKKPKIVYAESPGSEYEDMSPQIIKRKPRARAPIYIQQEPAASPIRIVSQNTGASPPFLPQNAPLSQPQQILQNNYPQFVANNPPILPQYAPQTPAIQRQLPQAPLPYQAPQQFGWPQPATNPYLPNLPLPPAPIVPTQYPVITTPYPPLLPPNIPPPPLPYMQQPVAPPPLYNGYTRIGLTNNNLKNDVKSSDALETIAKSLLKLRKQDALETLNENLERENHLNHHAISPKNVNVNVDEKGYVDLNINGNTHHLKRECGRSNTNDNCSKKVPAKLVNINGLRNNNRKAYNLDSVLSNDIEDEISEAVADAIINAKTNMFIRKDFGKKQQIVNELNAVKGVVRDVITSAISKTKSHETLSNAKLFKKFKKLNKKGFPNEIVVKEIIKYLTNLSNNENDFTKYRTFNEFQNQKDNTKTRDNSSSIKKGHNSQNNDRTNNIHYYEPSSLDLIEKNYASRKEQKAKPKNKKSRRMNDNTTHVLSNDNKTIISQSLTSNNVGTNISKGSETPYPYNGSSIQNFTKSVDVNLKTFHKKKSQRSSFGIQEKLQRIEHKENVQSPYPTITKKKTEKKDDVEEFNEDLLESVANKVTMFKLSKYSEPDFHKVQRKSKLSGKPSIINQTIIHKMNFNVTMNGTSNEVMGKMDKMPPVTFGENKSDNYNSNHSILPEIKDRASQNESMKLTKKLASQYTNTNPQNSVSSPHLRHYIPYITTIHNRYHKKTHRSNIKENTKKRLNYDLSQNKFYNASTSQNVIQSSFENGFKRKIGNDKQMIAKKSLVKENSQSYPLSAYEVSLRDEVVLPVMQELNKMGNNLNDPSNDSEKTVLEMEKAIIDISKVLSQRPDNRGRQTKEEE